MYFPRTHHGAWIVRPYIHQVTQGSFWRESCEGRFLIKGRPHKFPRISFPFRGGCGVRRLRWGFPHPATPIRWYPEVSELSANAQSHYQKSIKASCLLISECQHSTRLSLTKTRASFTYVQFLLRPLSDNARITSTNAPRHQYV